MLVALIVLVLLLLLFGGGGLVSASLSFLWWILIIGLVLGGLGFFFRSAEGGGRWHYWESAPTRTSQAPSPCKGGGPRWDEALLAPGGRLAQPALGVGLDLAR